MKLPDTPDLRLRLSGMEASRADLDVDESADDGKRGQKSGLIAEGAVDVSGMDAVKSGTMLCILLKGAVLPYGVRAEEVKHRTVGTPFNRCAGKARIYGPMLVSKILLIDGGLVVCTHIDIENCWL